MKEVFVSTSCLKGERRVTVILNQYIKAGITNIELGASHNYEEDIAEFLLKIKRKHNLSFTIHAYFPPPKQAFVLNLASEDPLVLKRSVDQIKKMINLGKLINAKVCGFHSGYLVDKPDLGKPFDPSKVVPYNKGYDNFLSSVKDICSYANSKGINIAMEPNVVCSFNVTSDGKKLLLMTESGEISGFFNDLARRGYDNLKLLLDIGHLKVSAKNLDFDPIDFIKNLSDFILEVHVHDNDGLVDSHSKIKENNPLFKEVCKSESKILTLEVQGLSIDEIIYQKALIERGLK